VGLALLTFAAYSGVTANGFVEGDDEAYVWGNPHVVAGLTGPSVRWALTSIEHDNWHPLTWISHMADVQMFGVDPGRHHATSLVLHVANVLILFFLLLRWTDRTWPAALAAGLFAIHPLHVESVAWIAERKDVLSTLFGLLTIGAWIRFLESRTIARYALVLAAFAAGLAAKPMLVTLPFALLLLDFWPLRRSWSAGLVREKLPLLAMAALSSVVTIVAQRRGGALQGLAATTPGDRIATAVTAYAGYLRHVVWPFSLAAFYRRPVGGFVTAAVAGSALVLIVLTAIAVRVVRRAPYVTFGWLWFLGTLVPVIGLVQVGDQAMADRYTYIPSIGLFVAAAWGVAAAARRLRAERVAIGAAAALLVALAMLTHAQAATWSSGIALYSHALAVDPDDQVAHNNLGLALYRAGRKDEALAHYRRAVELRPTFAGAQNNLGAVLAERGQAAEAIEHYEAALRSQAPSAMTLDNLGLALAAVGRLPEAMERWREALRLDPAFADAHNNLGVALAREGRVDEAIAELEAALRSRPDHAGARANLEQLRAGQRRTPEVR
jgi:tetratricopeptide (TPR) repeat protein